MHHTISLSKLAAYAREKNAPGSLCDDYLLLQFHSAEMPHSLPEAFKIDGIAIFLCMKGEANVRLNFNNIALSEGSIVVLSPNILIEPTSLNNTLEGYALFLPIDFVNQLNIDSNALDYNSLQPMALPIVNLDSNTRNVMSAYFNLLKINAEYNRDSDVYTRNIARSLVAAIFYQLMGFSSRNKSLTNQADESSADTKSLGRRRYYVRDFMSLVASDFRSQRSVSYYAQKLFISAKYLSLIIKEATGRTATEWIDHYVTLEAKNLLRYSGRNIQQIAYDLNFHNQSAFGKYFKHQTGMSPSEFRKS